MKYARLDAVPVIVDDCPSEVLNNRKIIEYAADHPYPVVFVGKPDRGMDREAVVDMVGGFAFRQQTGTLGRDQLKAACRHMLGIEFTAEELNGLEAISIKTVQHIRTRLDTLQVKGPEAKAKALEFLKAENALAAPAVDTVAERIGPRSASGFAR